MTFTDPRARSRALAVYGAMAGLGFVAGMVGGGVIAELWGWRWIFLVNLPITALTLIPAHRVLPESRTPAAGGRLDAGGAVALTTAATGSLADDHAGLAAGLLNTSTQLGGGAGLGIVAAVVTATAHGDLSTGALRAGFVPCIVFSALAVTLVLGGLRAPTHPGPGPRSASSSPARHGPAGNS